MEKFNEVLGTYMGEAFFGLKSFETLFQKNSIDTLFNW